MCVCATPGLTTRHSQIQDCACSRPPGQENCRFPSPCSVRLPPSRPAGHGGGSTPPGQLQAFQLQAGILTQSCHGPSSAKHPCQSSHCSVRVLAPHGAPVPERSGVGQRGEELPSVSGEASPHAPNTSPRTGSKVRSLCSTGPTLPGAVPQNLPSTFLALPAYSAGRARALLATASHRVRFYSTKNRVKNPQNPPRTSNKKFGQKGGS